MSGLGLRNITLQIEALLSGIDITSRAQFEKLGPKKTYLLLIEAGHPEDQELRQRLVGAAEDIDWHIVAAREKRRARSRFADVDEP